MNQKLKEDIDSNYINQLKLVLDLLPHTIVFVNKSYYITNFNSLFQEKYEGLFKISPKIGAYLFAHLPSTQINIFENILENAFQGDSYDDTDELCLSGEVYNVDYKILPVYDDKHNIIEVGIFIKASEDNTILNKLLSGYSPANANAPSHENIHVLIDNHEDPIWSVNTNFELIAFNTQFKEIYMTLNGEEVHQGRKMLENKQEDDYQLWHDIYTRTFDGEKIETIYSSQHDEGMIFFEIKTSPILDGNGEIQGATFIGRNITRQVLNEDKIKKNLAYQEAILNSGKASIWAVNKDFKLLFFNTRVYDFIKKTTGISIHIGSRIDDVWKTQSQFDIVKPFYDRAFQGEYINYQQKISWESQSMWVNFDFSPIYINNQITGVLVNARDITTKKQNEDFLVEAYQMAKMGNWFYDVEKDELVLSDSLCDVLNRYPPQNTLDFETLVQIIHPDDQFTFKNIIGTCLKTGEDIVSIKKVLIPDKAPAYLKCIVKAFRDEKGNVSRLIGTTQDITDSKYAELQIKSEKDFLANLIEHLPIGVFTKDVNQGFKYVIVNRKMEGIFRIKREDVIGKNDFEIEDDSEAAEFYHQTDLEVLKTQTPLHIQNVIIQNNDEQLIINITKLIIFDAQQKPRYILGMIEDVTSSKKYEEALKEAKEKAERATQSKSEFLSTVSHEIRTPMNAVIGLTNLLLDESPNLNQQEKLETLKFSAENLLALINDILDYNKIEAGKVEFEEVEFNLKHVCMNLKKSLDIQAKEKGLRLKVIFDEDIPDLIIGDTVRLSQILYNLLSNALKFTSQGSVKLIVELVEEKKDNTVICFSVIDTGIGIPEDKQDKIFEQFEQSSLDITRKYGGTGLGLSITKRLLELQNSHINLKSKPGEGSNFYFNLTFRKNQYKSSNTPLLKDPASRNDMLKGTRILVAEDNAINRFVIKNYLDKWSVISDYAENGKIAIDMVQESEYDLILMDLEMPELGGIDATISIRKLKGEQFKVLPIIALTASAMGHIRKTVMDAGMNDYVLKPFNPMSLYHKLIKHIRLVSKESYPPPLEITPNISHTKEPFLISLDSLERYNSSDVSFKVKFLLLLREETQKFAQQYREAMTNKDAQLLSNISHKIAPNLKLVNFTGLIDEIEQGKSILNSAYPQDDSINQNIQNIEKLISHFYQYVEDFLG